MTDVERDISLISCMYPDETVILQSEIIFTVKPSVDYGVHSLLQFDLTVKLTQESDQIPMKISIANPRGMDEMDIIHFTKALKQTVKRLRATQTPCFLFKLVQSTKEMLTEYNDHMDANCPICLETLGDAKRIC